MSSWFRSRQIPDGLVGDAEDFIRQCCAENGGTDPWARMVEVRREIRATGTYTHTPAELQWAARVAWRHAGRCGGRDKWRTLRVRDRREIRSPAAVADETIAHLREATNGGRIRSTITIFAPDAPGHPGPRIWNPQVIRYAGYGLAGGKIEGDPVNVQLTHLARRLGWKAGGGRFDVLPLIVSAPGHEPRAYPLPADAVLEVPITHPDFEWFGRLGLRWYAVPVITDMYLDAGGVRYPCAPFNGWYQAGTEVGVRNLGDRSRYDMLPAVAAGMRLDTSSPATMWIDRAVVELAVAVQHSFRAAGVMATDHHAEARRFMRFADSEESAGRAWTADWAWVNPPISASTTPTFHRTYPDPDLRPGYVRHTSPLPG